MTRPALYKGKLEVAYVVPCPCRRNKGVAPITNDSKAKAAGDQR